MVVKSSGLWLPKSENINAAAKEVRHQALKRAHDPAAGFTLPSSTNFVCGSAETCWFAFTSTIHALFLSTAYTVVWRHHSPFSTSAHHDTAGACDKQIPHYRLGRRHSLAVICTVDVFKGGAGVTK